MGTKMAVPVRIYRISDEEVKELRPKNSGDGHRLLGILCLVYVHRHISMGSVSENESHGLKKDEATGEDGRSEKREENS